MKPLSLETHLLGFDLLSWFTEGFSNPLLFISQGLFPEELEDGQFYASYDPYASEAVLDQVWVWGLYSLSVALIIVGLVFFLTIYTRWPGKDRRKSRAGKFKKKDDMKIKGRKFKASVSVVLGLVILGAVAYVESDRRKIPVIFSETAMLEGLWENYKEEYLEPETWRTLDKQRSNITTSEGQSYTMLRAVWMDDKDTFERSWSWTRDNLQRTEDNLFSWLFGEREDGTFGVLTQYGGRNVASDADVDIALALIFAYSRWQNEEYLEAALRILPDIWDHLVVEIRGRPYLVANNLEKYSGSDEVIINPSYFSPYAYRIFASVDRDRDWESLVDTSYDVLEQTFRLESLNGETRLLPPDWVKISRTTGELMVPNSSGLTTDFGFEAMRVPWRVALDFQWYEEPRAQQVLAKMDFLENEWRDKGRIYTAYTPQGLEIYNHESPAMYGMSLGYFLVKDEKLAGDIYLRKLLALYDQDRGHWRHGLSYYDDNLAWFGIALYNRVLTNLYLLNFR